MEDIRPEKHPYLESCTESMVPPVPTVSRSSKVCAVSGVTADSLNRGGIDAGIAILQGL